MTNRENLDLEEWKLIFTFGCSLDVYGRGKQRVGVSDGRAIIFYKVNDAETVTWPCQCCEAQNEIEYATDKQTLRCSECGAKHKVMGLHVRGEPITRLLYSARTGSIKKEVTNEG